MKRREDDVRKRICSEEEIREANLDHTIEGSFPASDPPSSIPDPCDPGALDEPRDEPAKEREEE